MPEGKIVKSWVQSCAGQAIIAVSLFLVILVGFIGLIALSIALPLTEDQRIYLWVIGFVLLLLLSMGVIFLLASVRFQRLAAQLDAAFIPLGLQGKAYLWNGRQYHGTYMGRQVDIYYYRGPTLDIYLAAPLNTRLGIGTKGRLIRAAAKVLPALELVSDDWQLVNLSFYPLDENWSRKLLANTQAKTSILRLVTAEIGLEFRNLLFQPEAIHLQINHFASSAITSQQVSVWFGDLVSLAGIAESLPLPQRTASASAMERRARLDRSSYTLPVVVITCGVIGFITALSIMTLILIIKLGGGL